MELFDGDLSRVLRSKVKILQKVKQSCFFQALEGLDYLHKSGIIHRDLRPKNILIKIEKDFYKTVLCDFGLSRKDSLEKSILINVSQNGYCRFILFLFLFLFYYFYFKFYFIFIFILFFILFTFYFYFIFILFLFFLILFLFYFIFIFIFIFIYIFILL